MSEAQALQALSNEALLAEVRRRGKEVPEFPEQARAALAENEVRPDVAGALAVAGASALGDHPDKTTQKRELAPDSPEAIALFAKLEARFGNTPAHYNVPQFHQLREGIQFAEVKAALTAHPELLWRLNWMEETGGQPDVWGKQDGQFIFRCSSAESPEGRRDCVYTQKAADELRAGDEKFNGSVEETAQDIGVHVVSAETWKIMNRTAGDGDGMGFTRETIDWMDSSNIADTGHALLGRRDGDSLCVADELIWTQHNKDWGWRAELMVPEAP